MADNKIAVPRQVDTSKPPVLEIEQAVVLKEPSTGREYKCVIQDVSDKSHAAFFSDHCGQEAYRGFIVDRDDALCKSTFVWVPIFPAFRDKDVQLSPSDPVIECQFDQGRECDIAFF